jgi:hypothetical protein
MAELGHQAQFQMAWILRHDEDHPTSVSSSKFEFNIRLMGSSVAGAISRVISRIVHNVIRRGV